MDAVISLRASPAKSESHHALASPDLRHFGSARAKMSGQRPLDAVKVSVALQSIARQVRKQAS